jgi:hypothetical protein
MFPQQQFKPNALNATKATAVYTNIYVLQRRSAVFCPEVYNWQTLTYNVAVQLQNNFY